MKRSGGIEAVVPAWGWLRRYQRADLQGDLTAGLIVAVMLIPQGMAYALLAGLPAIYGLYASTVPAVVYALFGTSRHMPVGPPALMALLTFAGVSTLAEPQSEEFIALALLLAVMAGVIQVLLGVLRMGFVTNFVPHPVLAGFIAASVIVITASQAKHLLGVDGGSGHSLVDALDGIARNIEDTHTETVAFGVGSIVTLLLARKLIPRVPGPLLVAVGATLVAYLTGSSDRGVDVVGEVPRGVPTLTPPPLDLDMMSALLPTALAVVLVGYIESFSVAKSIAAREKYKIDANQEFRALGLANVSAGLFSGFPVAGSFSRTAVNYQAGARTQLACIITAVMIVVSLLFLTPLLFHMPISALAAIIIVSVFRLLDLDEIKHIFRIRRADGLIMAVTAVTTLFVGIMEGILLGALFGLLAFLQRTVRPDVTELGYVPDSDAFLGLRSHPTARTDPRVVVLRFAASLYYANVSFLEERLMQEVADRPELEYIVIDCRATNSIDVTALDELEDLIAAYRAQGISVMLTHANLSVRERIKRAEWDLKFGPDIIGHPTTRTALAAVGLLTGLRASRGATDPTPGS